jgi:protein-disulfide isomerase
VITVMRAAALALFASALACGGSGKAQTTSDTAPPTAVLGGAAADTTDPLASRSKGARTAPVTVFEMSDFQCPFCRRFALETFPVLEREYIQPGKVRWVYVNFPLTSIHPNAVPAAEFALCAGRSGRFWPAHDLLFQTQEAWAKLAAPQQFLLGLADSIGIPRDSMMSCLQDSTTRRMVQEEATSSARAGATSTPSFYIEGGLLAGAHPPEIFRQVLDSIHRAKTAAR